MNKKGRILLLGHTGKMGTAIQEVFADDYELIMKNSSDFNALDFEQVTEMVNAVSPDIVINTVAYLGIDPCEEKPEVALRLNALYPRLLAELSVKRDFLLVHFSTDAVFDDKKGDYYVESDSVSPVNVYGLTKYAGDAFIQATANRYYICRIPVLFGPTKKDNQFVEKMLKKMCFQKTLNISDDIVGSPSYSIDIAKKIKELIENQAEFSLYHIANEGKASLYELICEIVYNLGIDVAVYPSSYKEFPHKGRKNTYTPLKSEKILPLRPWKLAVKDYCNRLKQKKEN